MLHGNSPVWMPPGCRRSAALVRLAGQWGNCLQRDPWAFNRTQEPLLGRCGVVDACPCITGLATVRHSVNCCVLLVVSAGQRGDCYRGGEQGGRAPPQMHRLPLSRFQ